MREIISSTVPKYILSIDGGGIRGIIPAVMLADIERKMKKPICKIFDLMAGTSTGGIIVAGLSKKNVQGKPQYSANDMVDLYLKNGPHIFNSSGFFSWVNPSLSWVYGARYPSKNIEQVLHNYFGDDILKHTSSHVLITSYDIYNNQPFFFKSWKEDSNFIKLEDVLRATTAAPTYFTPKRLMVHKTERVLVDGGLFANNPAACAYATSKALFPNDDILLLSIGTGRTTRSITYDKAKSFGKVGWIKPLIHLVFDSSLDAVNYQLERLIGDKYIRIQSKLQIASNDIDNVTAKNMSKLQQEANEMLRNNQKEICLFCDLCKCDGK